MMLENDDNTLTGNTSIGADRNGVITEREEIANPWPTANRIGGDSAVLENLVEGSGESAISVGGEPETTNEVLGNFGLGNGGPFITLREHHTGHPPNGEIKPPVLEVVRQSSVSGSAVPGAKVRRFGKPSTDPGSLERQIGSATADASGHWTATFATKLAVGKLVAATQTTAPGTPSGATSEVSAPVAPEAGPVVPTTRKRSSRVKFKATPSAGAKVECKLDGAKWASCKSPKTYKKLKVGKHTFRVRAKASGLTGAVAKFKFTVSAAT